MLVMPIYRMQQQPRRCTRPHLHALRVLLQVKQVALEAATQETVQGVQLKALRHIQRLGGNGGGWVTWQEGQGKPTRL